MTIHTTSSSAPARTAGMVVEHDGDREGTILLVDDEATRPRPAVRTLVAMPAYNEEAYIAKTIIGAKKHGDAVLVVDDGSKDDTVAIAEALGAIVVRHATNRGYGGALQTIFATARGMGVEELVIIDADGQHDPGDIPRLLSELRRGNDVVFPAANPQSGFGVYGQTSVAAVLADEVFDAGLLAADPQLKVAGVCSRNSAAEPRYRGKWIAVVIPTYNEEDSIREMQDGIPTYVTQFRVVSDGSPDQTHKGPEGSENHYRPTDWHIEGY